MNTTSTAPAATGGLIETLTAHGWTHTGPMKIDPQWRSVCQTIEDPDGRLTMNVAAFPAGNLVVTVSAEAIRDNGQLLTPAWTVDLSEWPREAIVAAATAATTATGPAPGLADDLRQAGWAQLADIREAGRLLERSWTSPDGTASVTWAPADDFDLGGWAVIRDIGGDRHEATASQDTPPAILTALAVTALTAANTTE